MSFEQARRVTPLAVCRRLAAAALALLALLTLATLPAPARAADDGITDYITIPAGSYIIDAGSLAPTLANSLKPYGLVFDLVRNQKVPVLWAINPTKAKDGTDFTDAGSGKAYRGGPFIVRAEFVTSAVTSVINSWRAQGVTVDGPTTAANGSVPIYDSISGLSNIALDTDNGSIAAGYFSAAGVPGTAYRYALPSALNSCDDMFAMPHADPTWSNHRNLIPFVQQKGYVWAACHAVSVLENIDDPATVSTNPDMNFLSLAGLVPYGSHADGSPPYTAASPADPVMQFIGSTDAAQLGGSEQIYLPRVQVQGGLSVGGWRPGARLLVTDPTQANVPALSPGPAAAIVYGRAYDNGNYGRVMYEGGHNHGGTAAANVAAQRAFLNFWLLALLERSPDATISVGGGATTVAEGSSITLSASVNHTSSIASYQWTSSGGGTFSAPTSASTTFTPPEVTSDTPIVIRLSVSDGCGRTAFDAYRITVLNVPRADLSITKTDSADPVGASQPYSYTLSVANLGPDTASSVTVTDVLPAGLTYVSASGSGWTCGYTSGTRTVACTRASLAVTGGSPSGITINVTSPATSGSVTNTATASSATPDPTAGNNSGSQTTSVLAGIDVAVTKTAPATVYVGGTFAYTLTAQNLSPVAATNLTVNDTLAASLTFVGASGSGWNCVYASVDRRVTCYIASLAASSSSVITVNVTPTGSAGSTIANTATIASPDFGDANLANNSSTVNVTLTANADLAIGKTASTTGGAGGQVDTYIVTVTNNGPGTATGVVVTDWMSGPGLTKYNAGCTATPSTGSVSPASPWPKADLTDHNTWSIASLANGASATLTLSCAGDNNDGVTNQASVSSTSYDPNSANNFTSAYLVEGTIKNGDLQLTKTVTPTTATTGSALTYRITLDNLGTQDANNTLTVTDTLPAGTTYTGSANVSGGGTWSCSHSAGVVTCTSTSDLKKAGGSPDQLFFDITATAPSTAGAITNTATLSYTWGPDVSDPPANNTGSVTSTVVYATTNVGVTKTVNNASPVLGANVTFTVTVTNSGANGATNLRVADLLPAGLSVVSYSATQGSYDPNTGLWFVGSLAAGASRVLTITANAFQPGAQTNQACFYAMDQPDSSSANDCASVVVTPQLADLGLTKTTSNASPDLNSNVTFTVTLSNLGSTAASSIGVQDALPDGLQYVSHSATAGTYNTASGIWSIPGPMAVGATATLTLVATVTVAETALTNTATITASSMPDPVTSNNTASASVTGRASDIALTKTVDQSAPVSLNTPLTFTITATNNGPSAAGSVSVTDALPAGLTYSSHGTSQGSYVPGTGVWTVGALANGASATLTLVANNTVYGRLTNTASRTATSPPDTGSTNDSATAQVLSGGSADLQLTKSVDKPTTYQGDTVTFTLRLDNIGPNPASGVAVQDLLPAGLTYASHVASQGSYVPGTGAWTVGALAVGQRVTLTITATVSASGALVNTATISALSQADPDTTNNTASSGVDAAPAADLSVTKTGPGTAAVGAAVSYTLIARNTGPSNVTAATLADTVPAQVTVTGWTCVATGSADCDTNAGGSGATGSTNAISLANVRIDAGAGNFLTLTVSGTATTPGTAVNTVVFSPPGNGSVYDSNVANNSASVSTVISNSQITGRVFADTGIGFGTANDGIPNGTEAGIANVTVRLTDCAATVHSSTTTDGAGNYTLGIPITIAAGTTLCVVQTNLSGHLSTGGQVGTTAGSYNRAADTVQFVMAGNAGFSGVNFGDAPENRFLTDGARTALPGTTVTYPHTYAAGSAGQVTFSLQSAASPAGAVWAEILYRDAGCDGALNAPADTVVSGAITVAAGDRVCLLVQQFVPAGLAAGATSLVTVQAFFAYANASPALSASASRQDLTTVSDTSLQLVKEVRNLTLGGAWGTSNTARPGEVLEYRITFTNAAVAALNNLAIVDATPAFTTFVAAACTAPLPANLSTCTITAPSVAATGSVRWQFLGTLASALSGSVTYQVRVQ